jgi:membrane associated rhomboid family serine protease
VFVFAGQQGPMAFSTETENDAPRMTRAVQGLIAINVAVFFLQIALVGNRDMWGWLAFDRGDLAHSLWTVVTYAFVHAGPWHLFVNMLALWSFGPRVEHGWSAGRFVAFYLWCALGGVLGHLMFGGDGMLMGASAAVMGVMLAYAMQWPDDEMLLFMVIPMKVKWAVTFFILFNLVMGLGAMAASGLPGTQVAYMAHLGGLAFAWFYLRTPSAQSLDRLRQRISPVADLPDETPRAIPRSLPRPRERTNASDEAVAKSKAVVVKRPVAPQAPRAVKDPKADALNTVLDKISAAGIESLTNDEKRLLEEMSRKLRGPS